MRCKAASTSQPQVPNPDDDDPGDNGRGTAEAPEHDKRHVDDSARRVRLRRGGWRWHIEDIAARWTGPAAGRAFRTARVRISGRPLGTGIRAGDVVTFEVRLNRLYRLAQLGPALEVYSVYLAVGT